MTNDGTDENFGIVEEGRSIDISYLVLLWRNKPMSKYRAAKRPFSSPISHQIYFVYTETVNARDALVVPLPWKYTEL